MTHSAHASGGLCLPAALSLSKLIACAARLVSRLAPPWDVTTLNKFVLLKMMTIGHTIGGRTTQGLGCNVSGLRRQAVWNDKKASHPTVVPVGEIPRCFSVSHIEQELIESCVTLFSLSRSQLSSLQPCRMGSTLKMQIDVL